jgi:hypothetical protein
VNGPADNRLDAIAAAILDYLRRFPNARDTVRGVREWWLPRALRDRPLAEVEQALARLVHGGQVVVRTVANGVSLYAKAPAARVARFSLS